MDDTSPNATAVDADAVEPQEHGNRLARNALGLAGNIGIALGSSASTASVALTLAAIVAVSSFASPIAILICGLPMLAIAAAFRRLNRWRVNCGATYAWGGRAISPYFGFIVGWITILAYVVGVVSISLPIGPYVVSLFGNSSSRPGEAIVGFAAVVLATVIAYIGIKLTAWTQWVLIAIEYTGVGILAIWCLVAVFSHNPHSVPFSWSWFSWSSMGGINGFIGASLIAVYMFSGWDTGILVNEETSDAREKPGQSVVASVIVLALMYAFLTFALQGAVHTKDLEANGDNALSYIAQVISGSALAKYMILAVALSALGSTLASLVSGVRVTFAMGSDGVLPRQFGKTDSRFKTPILATVIIGVIASIGVWLYTFGSGSVQDSFHHGGKRRRTAVRSVLRADRHRDRGVLPQARRYRSVEHCPAGGVPARRGGVPGLHHRAIRRRAGRLERQGSRLAVRDARHRRGDHALRAVHGRIGLLQAVEGDLPAPGRTPARKPRAVTCIT
jgi:amino acid transporter